LGSGTDAWSAVVVGTTVFGLAVVESAAKARHGSRVKIAERDVFIKVNYSNNT
jgi:hypothetical protein